LEHRKYYSGYLKGMHNASQARQQLMVPLVYNEVEDILMNFLDSLKKHPADKSSQSSRPVLT
jgi:hypothetical protein